MATDQMKSGSVHFQTNYDFTDPELNLLHDLVIKSVKNGHEFDPSPTLEILDLRKFTENQLPAPIPFINYDVEFLTRKVARTNIQPGEEVLLDGAYVTFFNREDADELGGMLVQEMENRHYTFIIV